MAVYSITASLVNTEDRNNSLWTGGSYIRNLTTTSFTIIAYRMSDEQYNRVFANQNFTGRFIAIGH